MVWCLFRRYDGRGYEVINNGCGVEGVLDKIWVWVECLLRNNWGDSGEKGECVVMGEMGRGEGKRIFW